VLDVAYNSQPDTRSFMDELLAGHDLKSRKCGDIRTLFTAVGVMKKNLNTDAAGGGSQRKRVTDFSDMSSHTGASVGGAKKSIADLNKRNAEFYANK